MSTVDHAIARTPAEIVREHPDPRRLDVIDVRTPVEYAEVHVEGARLVPLDTLDVKSVMTTRPGAEHEPLYVVCRTGKRGATAVERFRAAGYTNVINVEGGTVAWERAGLPVVRGRGVISLERQVRITAGALVVTGIVLGWFVHPGFLLLSAFVGTGLVFAGVTDWCGMAMLLAKMPWNNRTRAAAAAADVRPATVARSR